MKNKYPSISIVTPSFNQGNYIQETIESVLKQKYSAIEYLVVDGKSTDSTVAVLKSYGKKISWLSESDTGQTNAINKGIRKTSGSIIGYLNSDDTLRPGALKKIGTLFRENPDVQWITGDYAIIDGRGKQIQSFVCTYKRELRKHLSMNSLLIANSIAQPSTFWRRSFMNTVGQFDESLRYCMDYQFWLRCMQHSKPLVVPDILSNFRIHTQSKGGSQYRNQFSEELDVAATFTSNPALLLLHKMHTAAIITAYSFLK